MDVILVRHGSAVPSGSVASDGLRPLSPAGEHQAHALAETLAPLEFAKILTSPALRCQATVAPTAMRHGVAVEEEPCLAEGGWTTRDLAALLDRLEAVSRGVLVCGHAPSLLRLATIMTVRYQIAVPGDELALRPASVLLARYGDATPRRLESLVRLDPPTWGRRRLVG